MPVTALYAALLALLFIALSIRVIGGRRSNRVSVGDGGNHELLRRMRMHANFAEYAPLALIMMGLIESMQADRWIIHALGAVLLIGRLSHAYGMSGDGHMQFRVAGMVMTFTVLAAGALLCIFGALWHGV